VLHLGRNVFPRQEPALHLAQNRHVPVQGRTLE
jgi:hypothetical protein